MRVVPFFVGHGTTAGPPRGIDIKEIHQQLNRIVTQQPGEQQDL